jgi:hypothetical protein
MLADSFLALDGVGFLALEGVGLALLLLVVSALVSALGPLGPICFKYFVRSFVAVRTASLLWVERACIWIWISAVTVGAQKRAW